MYVAKAIRHHGPENFSIIEIGRAEAQGAIDALECAAIAFFRSTDHRFGYNLESGGRKRRGVAQSTRDKLRLRMVGRKLSAEHKEKLRLANVGKGGVNWTPEARRKLSETRKNSPKLQEQIRALSKARIGKPLSEAHRLALSQAKRRKGNQLWLM